MDQSSKQAVFEAQVKNVRSLRTALKQVKRCINDALRSNDQARVSAFTKTYALLFCSWAEANFSKIIHTPHGFSINEIQQILTAKSNGISMAWKKSVELGLRYLEAQKSNFKPNTKQKLLEVIDQHVFDPSLFRNKLAHGQWTVALNRQNSAVQEERTLEIERMDVVQIDSWIRGHELMANAIETLIESPRKAFMRDWYQFVVDLEKCIVDAEQRTLEQHMKILIEKDVRTVAAQKKKRLGRS